MAWFIGLVTVAVLAFVFLSLDNDRMTESAERAMRRRSGRQPLRPTAALSWRALAVVSVALLLLSVWVFAWPPSVPAGHHPGIGLRALYAFLGGGSAPGWLATASAVCAAAAWQVRKRVGRD